MRGIANERGLKPLFEGELRAGPALGAEHGGLAGSLEPRVPRGERVKRALDGVSGLGWSVIGFLLGAVFWHFVGFWGFVSEVVLAGKPAATVEERVPGTRAQWIRSADAAAALPTCIALALDRRTGVTSARACAAGFVPRAADGYRGREDRMVIPDTAETWIAPHAPAGALASGEP